MKRDLVQVRNPRTDRFGLRMASRFNGLEAALANVPDDFVMVLTIGHDHEYGVSARLVSMGAEDAGEPARARMAADAVRMAISS